VARVEVIDRLAAWSDGRDTFPPGHSDRVGALCRLMAEGLGLDEAEATVLARAASLHDIGKIALPVEVLHHDGPLGEVETRAIRTHPRRGAALVRLLDPDEAVCRTVLCHHERPDGSGYLGFQGEKVPRTASILAVAECVDAMTSTTLSVRHSSGEAVGMLRSQEAGVYDADCVEALADRLKPRPDVIPLSAPFVPSG
jgi:HD-GYP domain-containing protein (c-di-GMP phosphodiesterase class II)